jgi:hypothetical protein
MAAICPAQFENVYRALILKQALKETQDLLERNLSFVAKHKHPLQNHIRRGILMAILPIRQLIIHRIQQIQELEPTPIIQAILEDMDKESQNIQTQLKEAEKIPFPNGSMPTALIQLFELMAKREITLQDLTPSLTDATPAATAKTEEATQP